MINNKRGLKEKNKSKFKFSFLFIFFLLIFILVIGGGVLGYLFYNNNPETTFLKTLNLLSESLDSSNIEFELGTKLTEQDNLEVNWEHTRTGLTSQEFIITIKQDSSWWDASWKYRKQINISNDNIDSDLTEFPL